MIIRPYQTADLKQCAALHKQSRRESEKGIIFDSDLDRYDLKHFEKNWSEWSSYQETQILVAVSDDLIVGFVMYGKIKTRPDFDKGVVPRYGAEIYALYVHPDNFRKNIGTQLFDNACRNLADLKLTSLILWALKKNKRACLFYESLGGERIAKQKIEMGEKSWAEESCFGWRDIRKIIQ